MTIIKDDRTDEQKQTLTCTRCGRELRPWPLKRPNLCSPKDWVYCIREE